MVEYRYRCAATLAKEANGMANQEQVDILKQGVNVWNEWRREHPDIRIDLRETDFSGADLSGANFSKADFKRANLNEADLSRSNLEWVEFQWANLVWANLSEADLHEARFMAAELRNAKFIKANLQKALINDARLPYAIFHGAKLKEAYLWGSDLRETDFSGADLSGANLMNTQLALTNFTGATLSGCRIYGASAWDVKLEGAKQINLVITPPEQPTITVDNLKVAQFIYLLLNNPEIREVIDTITSKVVLILGRFTPERKAVLDALREELRAHNYTPILFDFEKPASRDLTETVSTLAHLARFIVVDLTDPSSAPYEVATIIPQTVVPVQPLLLRGPLVIGGEAVERREFAMFEDLRRRYDWVLPTFRYQDTAELLASLQTEIIELAEQKARELTQPR
jgi:uncharacterized protein YjbI with pentapeptide repeats